MPPPSGRASSETSSVAVQTVTPSPTWAGVLGMARTMAGCRSVSLIEAIVTPGMIDLTAGGDPLRLAGESQQIGGRRLAGRFADLDAMRLLELLAARRHDVAGDDVG